jgi:hypothetical protein
LSHKKSYYSNHRMCSLLAHSKLVLLI